MAGHALALAVLGSGVLLRVHPRSEWYPVCPVYRLFHVPCPGCGATRAVAALLQGHLHEAMRWNALVVIALPLLVLYAAAVYGRMIAEQDFRWPEVPVAATYGCLGITVSFEFARLAGVV